LAEFVAQLRVSGPLADLAGLIEAEREGRLYRADSIAAAHYGDRLEVAAAELVAIQVDGDA
jgi:hypothetical protein